MGLIKLFLDRQNRKIVAINGGAGSVPDLFQSNSQDFEITIIDPTGAFAAPYQYPNLSTSGLRVSIGDTPAGTTGGTPLALSTSWTWVPAGGSNPFNKFTGTLALNTAAIDTFLGTLASKPCYFEINETISGNRNTLYQAVINIKAVVDELSGTAPSPSTQYYDKDSADATFPKFQMGAGQTLTLVSPDGTKGVILSVDNDGNFLTSPIAL